MSPAATGRIERVKRGVEWAGTHVVALLGAGCTAIVALFFFVSIFFGGCRQQVLVPYGMTLPRAVGTSVNGTDVLMGMFSEAGHRVTTRRALVSSRLETVDAIVWFPDDRWAPSEELCEWFDNWLAQRPGRTLVYIGRDFDAEPRYWRSMLPYVSQSQQPLYREQLFEAAARATRGSRKSGTSECPWFEIEAGKRRNIHDLKGTWSEGVDAANVDIEVRDRLVPTKGAVGLLTSDKDQLVSRRAAKRSKIIVIDNGSFLLNLPLVNHEHRLLAEHLIAAVGSPGRVVFLESGSGGPPIEPEDETPGLWRFLGAWPLNVILLQLAAMGIIFCFARWPILGRPKAPAAEVTSDFRKHVEAVGKLLSATHDRHYAYDRLADVQPRHQGSERAVERGAIEDDHHLGGQKP